MHRFILKRILQMIPVLLGVLLIVFIINRISGDPVAQKLQADYTQEQYDAVKASMGLDKSYPIQFFNYVWGVITRLDLGNSYFTNRSVWEEVRVRLPLSLQLACFSMVIAIIIGVVFGIISAVKQYSALDYSATIIAMICASMPSFWVGMVLMLIFSVTLKWFPATGLGTWKHWILPCIAIGLAPIASICRMTRTTMLEVIRQDYVRTARSKGLSNTKVIFDHALKNCAIPIITVVGLFLSVTIGNSVVVESVFAIPGLGSYIVNSINARDFPNVQGAVLVFSIVVCLMSLIMDVAYGLVDPRIRAQYSAKNIKTKKGAALKSYSSVIDNAIITPGGSYSDSNDASATEDK